MSYSVLKVAESIPLNASDNSALMTSAVSRSVRGSYSKENVSRATSREALNPVTVTSQESGTDATYMHISNLLFKVLNSRRKEKHTASKVITTHPK